MPTLNDTHYEAEDDDKYGDPERHFYDIEGASSRRADRISRVVEENGTTLSARFDNCSNYIRTIVNAVNDRMKEAGLQVETPKEFTSKVVVTFNTLNPKEDFARFVRALSVDLKSQNGEEVTVVLDPEMAEEMIEKDRNNPLSLGEPKTPGM